MPSNVSTGTTLWSGLTPEAVVLFSSRSNAMHRRTGVLIVIAVAALAGLAAAPMLGLVSFSELRRVPVLWEIRVPRAILAFLAGAGLSLAGMTFQAVFRNPLVEPFTLGV